MNNQKEKQKVYIVLDYDAPPKNSIWSVNSTMEKAIKSGKWIGGKVLDRKGNIKPFTHLKIKLTSYSSSFYFIAEIKEIERLHDVVLRASRA